MILLVNVRFSVILGFRVGDGFLHLFLGNDSLLPEYYYMYMWFS